MIYFYFPSYIFPIVSAVNIICCTSYVICMYAVKHNKLQITITSYEYDKLWFIEKVCVWAVYVNAHYTLCIVSVW